MHDAFDFLKAPGMSTLFQTRAAACRRLAASLLVGGVATLGAVHAAQPDDTQPDAYAQRWPLELTAQAPLQRITLPASALVSLQNSAQQDVRIFNAQGQAVPLARLPLLAQTPLAPAALATLVAYPIWGTETAAVPGEMSLRLSEKDGQRVFEMRTGMPSAAADSPPTSPASAPVVLGAILDARAVTGKIDLLRLDVDLPPGQPIRFDVQVSADLSNWQPLAHTVLYQPPAAPAGAASTPALATLGHQQLALRAASLQGQYLRITWQGAQAQASGVALRGATLFSTPSASGPQRLPVALAGLTLNPAPQQPALAFGLPFATALAAISITPAGDNALVAVRILGRESAVQVWTPLAQTVVYRLAGADAAGSGQTSGPIELPRGPWREIAIETEAQGPRLASPPAITVWLEPVQLAFVASGSAPFTLATGLAEARSGYWPLDRLASVGSTVGAQDGVAFSQRWPQANVGLAQGSSPPATTPGGVLTVQVLPIASAGSISTRTGVLWAVLLLGVLGLAAMAWVLVRQTNRLPTDAKTTNDSA